MSAPLARSPSLGRSGEPPSSRQATAGPVLLTLEVPDDFQRHTGESSSFKMTPKFLEI